MIQGVASADETLIDYRRIGTPGLREYGGFIYEDSLPKFRGREGARIYQEMCEMDASCGAILHLIDSLLRQVNWTVEDASDSPEDREASEFLKSCLGDMEISWDDTISDIFSFLQYGFSAHEIVYKRRCGDADAPWLKSKYVDGRVGWRILSGRAQDTIYRWRFKDNGYLEGFEQLAPPLWRLQFIPIEKVILFRTRAHKANPEGYSIFRNAHRAWWIKKNLENIESIGIERDLAGLPVATVPPELLTSSDPDAKKMLEYIKKIVINTKRDEQEGLVLPSLYDDNNNKLYDFQLMTSGGSRQMNVSETINRWDLAMFRSLGMDFLMLGSSSGTGSFSMHSDKTALFMKSLSSYLDIAQDGLNKAVERLFRMNTFNISDYPKLVYSPLEKVDLTEMGDFITKMVGAGMQIFPDKNMENYVREITGWPDPTVEQGSVQDNLKPKPFIQHGTPTEIADDGESSELGRLEARQDNRIHGGHTGRRAT